jgi:hypothetical protein
MRKLIRVDNTGEGHLNLYFSNEPAVDTEDNDALGEDEMIIPHVDEFGRVCQIEVLFVDEPSRIDNLFAMAKRLDLDISPLFSTYAGSLAA